MSVQVYKNGIVSAGGSGVGENLILGTGLSTYSTTANTANDRNRGMLSGGSGGNGKFSVTEDDTVPVGRYSFNVLNNTSGNRDFQQGNIPYIQGEKYTGSWWAKGNGTCLYRSWNRTDGKQMFSKTFSLTDEWKYYYYTFTASAEYETDDCSFHLGVTGASSINIAGMKLELGSHPTPWTPAPSDAIYVGAEHGFIETDGSIAKFYDDFAEANGFIEY